MILLLVWAAVVGSLYSGFLHFYSNFEEISNYNKAYYASLWALERAELALKYHKPWYEASAWRQNSNNTWTYRWLDEIPDNFSYLSAESKQKSSLFWRISSRTTRIPSTWNGDVERLLSTGDSANYNTMGYEHAEIFLLYNDETESNKNPYDSSKISQNTITDTPDNITWKLRLPWKLQNILWKLNENKALITNQNQIEDDAIVDWQIRWQYGDYWDQFTVFSYQDKAYKPKSHAEQADSAIRESDINDATDLNFTSNSRTPTNPDDNKAQFTVISPQEGALSSTWLSQIIKISSPKQIRLSLLNLLKSENDLIYPFLEYYLDFGDFSIPDKYYTINAEWKYWDFQVNLIVKKPSIQESILWNFTVVF